MKTPTYIGGWKSVFYSLHVMKEVGLGNFTRTLTSKNTCKTCAYGMGGQKGGMVNEAGDKIEICKKSLQAQLTDLQEPIASDFWKLNSIPDLLKWRPRELERAGRLADPVFKEKNETKYKVISWEEAFFKISKRFKETDPERAFFYSSGRSSNEAAFLLHLFARIYGTNNVNNCSYYCHQASGVGMGATLGTGTATIQLEDLKQTDLIFVIGANPASNHPRFVTELLQCRRRGGKVIVINPAKEPGLVKFAIPSDVRSFLSSGSEIASQYLQPTIGGDIALIYGIAKYLIENNLTDQVFIQNHCQNQNEFFEKIGNLSWELVVEASGVEKAEIEIAAKTYYKAQNVVFTWAMGITHHKHGVENVEAIVALAMLRGMIGRKNAGLLPLRGHSNVQGIGSVGVTPVLKQQIFDNIQKELKIMLPEKPGWDTMECMRMAYDDKVDLAFILGGNLYGSNPNLNFAEKALNNIPFKVFLSTTLNEGHLKGVDQECLILPVLVRDEEKQRTTQESMFNFVRLSDGGINRLANAKGEVEIIAEIAGQVVDKQILDFKTFKNHDSIRKAISQVIPGFEKLAEINSTEEEFQIKGRTFHTPFFPTPSGKGIFKFHKINAVGKPEKGSFKLMSVRSEGQFNSIVYDEDDAWRGVKHREVILMNEHDMQENKLSPGQKISISSYSGKLNNYEVYPFNIARGCVLGYYPETNVLVNSDLDPRSKTPAFKNTLVKIIKAD